MMTSPRFGPRRWAIGLALFLAITGGVAAGLFAARHTGSKRPTASASAPVETATVQRTTLASRSSVTGTLGYQGTCTIAATTNGILTADPSIGSIINRGQALFSINNITSYLMYGSVPAWRDYTTWSTPGPDIAELTDNLAAMGYLAPAQRSDHPSWQITQAVERWQHNLGVAATGKVTFGQIVFAPWPIRVTTISADIGTTVSAGSALVSATSTALGVGAAVDPTTAASLSAGNKVLVSTPDGQQRPARVTSISTVATSTPSSTEGQATVTVPVAITFTPAWTPTQRAIDQAPVSIAITVRRATDVLAVPVTALLASTGGYVVELNTTPQQTVPVTPGLFDDLSGLVEVTGALHPGQTVLVAAS